MRADLKQAYLQVVDRSLDAADAALGESLQEFAAFSSYHAFESHGGAFCTAQGVKYPLSHKKKILEFQKQALQGGFRGRIGRQVTVVATIVASLRNDMLYPRELGGAVYALPENAIDLKSAQRVRSRVRGLCKVVKREL